jgi:gluconate kinase
MPPSLLQSQFDTLEMPEQALSISIDATPDQIVERILRELRMVG